MNPDPTGFRGGLPFTAPFSQSSTSARSRVWSWCLWPAAVLGFLACEAWLTYTRPAWGQTGASASAGKQPPLSPDGSFSVNKNYVASGMTGDIKDVTFGFGERDSMRFTYVPDGRQEPHEWDYKYIKGELNKVPAKHAGVLWLSPPQRIRHGEDGGYDLRKLKPNVIKFEARSLTGPIHVRFTIGGVQWKWREDANRRFEKQTVPYPDTVSFTSLGIKRLTGDWRTYECHLAGNLDFTRLVGGFGWMITWADNGIESPLQQAKRFEFEVRDIRFEAAPPRVEPRNDVFNVYNDADASDNHFTPTGLMGDCGDIHIVETWADNPHSGKTCIRVVYDAAGNGPHECNYQGPCNWGGLYWQHPPNNWGKHTFWKGRGSISKVTNVSSSQLGPIEDAASSFSWGGWRNPSATVSENGAGPSRLHQTGRNSRSHSMGWMCLMSSAASVGSRIGPQNSAVSPFTLMTSAF